MACRNYGCVGSPRTPFPASCLQTVKLDSRAAGIFIKLGHRFRAVDQLLTNFHLPQSTLLVLVSEFADRELILRSYRDAVESGYRFYSYGDCMWR